MPRMRLFAIAAFCACGPASPVLVDGTGLQGSRPNAPSGVEAGPPEYAITFASVAALPLVAKGGSDAQLMAVLDDVVLDALQNQARPGIKVVGRSDIDALLGMDKAQQALGCDDLACSAELAGALGVDAIVSGAVGRLGSKYVLTLSFVDRAEGKVLSRASRELSDIEALSGAVREAMGGLLLDVEALPIPSPASSLAVAAEMVNATDTTVRIDWLDLGAQVKTYATLAAGETRGQGTYLGHRWQASDADGRVIARWIATPAHPRWVIRRRPVPASAWAGTWVGRGTNTWSSRGCVAPSEQSVPLQLVLAIEAPGLLSGTLAFADSTPTPLRGQWQGNVANLGYGTGSRTVVALHGDRLTGVYEHADGGCAGWGGPVELTRR